MILANMCEADQPKNNSQGDEQQLGGRGCKQYFELGSERYVGLT